MSTLVLHVPQFDSANAPSHSGYTQKLACFLRLCKLTYTIQPTPFSASPTKKLPFVTLDGRVLADSDFIIKHLVEHRLVEDPDAALTPLQKLDSRALTAWTDDRFYPVLVDTRWRRPSNYAHIASTFPLPWPVRVVLPWYLRRQITSALWTAGAGRYGEEQQNRILEEWCDGLVLRLRGEEGKGEGRWLMRGESPTTVDAVVVGFWLNLLVVGKGNSEAIAMFRERQEIKAYVRRAAEMWFPEYDVEGLVEQ